MNSPESSLTEVITRCHEELDECFLVHQEAVLSGRFQDAIQLLGCFIALHDLHAVFEDDKLIPRLVQLGDRGRWLASLYAHEHTKLRALLNNTENALLVLADRHSSGESPGRAVIAFLDSEKTLKGLCEHHQQREEAGLLPELDEQTDTQWRASIIGPFMGEWNACVKRNRHIIESLKVQASN